MVVRMKQVTLQEIRIIVFLFREGEECGIESLIGITLKPLPGFAAKREISGVTERDVFQKIESGPSFGFGSARKL